MSTVLVSNIDASSFTNGVVDFSPRLTYPGTIIQTRTLRVDTRTTYSSLDTGNGTTVAVLGISITPIYASSRLIVQWMINGECNNDNGFLIHRDGALITTTGEEGYNNQGGNVRWSCYTPGYYDRNDDSTGINWNIFYSCAAGSTTARTYAPAVRATGSGSHTFALNRTLGDGTQNYYESMVSFALIHEVCNQ
jgi:hypothetical protein